MLIFHLIKTSKGATWALNLIKEQKLNNPSIQIAVALPKGGSKFNDYLKLCDYVYEMDYTLNFKLFVNGMKLRSYVKEIQPDIIHSWFTQTTLFARIFLRDFKIPRLFQVVGPAHLDNTIFKWFDILSANKMDQWVATSKYIEEIYLNAGVVSDRIHFNYAFIDPIKLRERYKKSDPINYHQIFNLPPKTIILGTASYIYSPKFYQNSGIKSHEQLIESFELLCETRDDLVLIIAGESFNENRKYYDKLKKIADNKCGNKIFFTGSYSNVYEVIGNFDVFIYLSKMENLGGVFESLLLQIPTVSSNSGGLPELVKHGETGLNSNFNNISAIANNVTKLINDKDLQEKFKENGLQLVMNTFNSKFIVQNSMSIYHKVQIN